MVGIPVTEQISLMAIGTPIRGPKSVPAEIKLSIAIADFKAPS